MTTSAANRTTGRHWAALGLAGALTLPLLAAPASGATPTASTAPFRTVVVLAGDLATGAGQAAVAVRAAGGRVLDSLPLVGGVSAELPASARLAPSYTVVPDRRLTLTGEATAAATAPSSTVRATLGLPPAGNEGSGVTVAVVDTGIADVADLAGQVRASFDLTDRGRDRDDIRTSGDGYGHGTFMAGLIAGTGASSGGAVRGVAPGAKLVDVKVADERGETSLIRVLRGLSVLSSHGRRLGVRVVNLSLSSGSTLPYQLDPLNLALQGLWDRGMVVVVPSGNTDGAAGSVTSPGNDPTLLTVGGLDEAATAARGDDGVAAWSGRGPSWQGDAKPDLAAPGASVLSLRAPGSAVDRAYPSARVGGSYFRGSGTSMATAVTAAAAAAVLAQRPELTPSDVKTLFTTTSYRAPGLTRGAAGAGGLDAAAALAAAGTVQAGSTPDRAEAVPGSLAQWRRLLDAIERGDAAAASRAWAALDPASRAWASRAWATLDPASRAWASRAWASRAWAWANEDVDSQEWMSIFWASRAWASRAWASRAWASRAWASRAWAADDWLSRAWAGGDWDSRAWASRAWASRAWASRAWATHSWE